MGKFSKAIEKSSGVSGKPLNSAAREKRDRLEEVKHKPAKTIDEDTGRISVSLSSAGWDERLKLSTDPYFQYFENFRRLRASILYPKPGSGPRTMLVTSIAPCEGKGFVCANMGVALSQDVEHHALMLDCDFRRPTLAKLFGVSNDTGLVDYLQDGTDLSSLIRKTGQPKLSLIPSGKPPRNPAELLSSQRMASVIKELAERYPDRLILVDSPPYAVASETNILAQHLDSVILVIRHGFSKKEHVKKFVEVLGTDKIAGLVYNGYPQNAFGQLLDKKMGYAYSYNY